jgi:alpha-amylase
MMKWALNPTAFLQIEHFERQLKDAHLFEENSMFVHGGFWRNFLSKYPEANHMHKKMLRVANRAHTHAEQGTAIDQEILDHIWAGQCNDPYWHGVFGGLYLPNLRFPVYRNLLQAESKLDELDHLPPVRVEEVDFDCDGFSEILIESDQMNLYFTPHRGGSLVELDYKPIAFNLLDIVSRREEGYHRRLMSEGFKQHAQEHDGVVTKEPGLEKHLHFDWYRRASLLDHFFDSATTLESFAQCKYLELGDFVNQPYESRITQMESKGGSVNAVELALIRDGALWREGESHRLTVSKLIHYDAGISRFSVDYTLVNREESSIDVWFGVEWNVGLMAGDAHDRYYRFEGKKPDDPRLKSTGEETDVTSLQLVDEWLGIEVGFSTRLPATVWRFPIETVSLSEAGFERLYQSSVITFHWKVRLEKECTLQLVQSVKKL